MAMLPKLSLALLVGSTVSTTASANVVASDGYATEAKTPTPTRVEGRVGMLIGGSDVGDVDGFSMGVSAGLGYRIGDLTLRGLFDHYRTGDSADEANDRRGRGTRVGGAVRYSFASTGDRDSKGLGVDFWGELGLGLEHVAWRQGGVLDRPSGELAVGFELDGQGERNDRTRRRRHVGYFMAFRTLIAEGPEMDGVTATCGGPCTKATKPSRTDISMFFELGLHWGR
jgi:hypothetical protein